MTSTGASQALSGTAEDLALALATTSGHTGTVALTATSASGNSGADYVAQLKAINALTTGTITLTSTGASQALSGTATDLALALATTSGHTGTVAIDGAATAATLAELKTINGNTTGTITLGANTAAANYSGIAADLAAALGGTLAATHTGTVAVTGGVAATIVEYNAINAATTGVITTPVAATSGADSFVFNNNILSVGTTTAFAQAADSLSFVGMTGNGGTLAELDIVNDGTGTDGATLHATNSTVYVIDTDATDLIAGTTAKTIVSFTNMANVAAFLTEGFVTSNTTGKVDYFVINDGSDATKAYAYKFVDTAGDTVLNADGTGLTLIGTITTNAALTAAANITIS